MLKAVLCDLDGTLIDSNALHAACWVEAFAQFGHHFSQDEVLHQIGKGGDELLSHFLPEDRLSEIREPLKKDRKTLFEQKYMDRIKPFPEVRTLLQKMKGIGLRVALASSTDREHLDRLKAIAQVEDLIEEETTSSDAEKSKPHPDIFQAAMERLKLQPADCVALGDTPWDIQAARKAQVDTVAVICGGWTELELQASGALAVYRDPADLAARFDASVFRQRSAARLG